MGQQNRHNVAPILVQRKRTLSQPLAQIPTPGETFTSLSASQEQPMDPFSQPSNWITPKNQKKRKPKPSQSQDITTQNQFEGLATDGIEADMTDHYSTDEDNMSVTSSRSAKNTKHPRQNKYTTQQKQTTPIKSPKPPPIYCKNIKAKKTNKRSTNHPATQQI